MGDLLFLIIFCGLGFVIAFFLGKKRQIGVGWSFFFCFFLSPLFGFVITMLSRKYYSENPQRSILKIIVGVILILFFLLSGLGGILTLAFNPNVDPSVFNVLFASIGFVGLGAYLISLGRGRNFNSAALTNID